MLRSTELGCSSGPAPKASYDACRALRSHTAHTQTVPRRDHRLPQTPLFASLPSDRGVSSKEMAPAP